MIDLRSDTVTRPGEAMLDAMRSAETGDDVYGEDPTVNELESLAASLTGKEAALLTVSGTQSNLLALMSHCQRGDEYIAGQTAHSYQFEAGGAAVLGGIQPCPIPFTDRGELPLEAVRAAFKPDDFHFAITRLVCLENTQSGKVLSLDYLSDFYEVANELGLKKHLDGARLFNAVVCQNVAVDAICRYFDTVSICLSKGLGCPVGSLLVGDASTIARARRTRKMLGGGMRQAGIIAAAGIYALNNNINRLQQDHDNTQKVCDAISRLNRIQLAESPQSNMLMLDSSVDVGRLAGFLKSKNILISGRRWVFHMDISAEDVDHIVDACGDFDRL